MPKEQKTWGYELFVNFGHPDLNNAYNNLLMIGIFDSKL